MDNKRIRLVRCGSCFNGVVKIDEDDKGPFFDTCTYCNGTGLVRASDVKPKLTQKQIMAKVVKSVQDFVLSKK